MIRFVLIAISLSFGSFLAAQEKSLPPAPRLLPKDTLAFVRVESADEMRITLAEMQMSKMLADPSLRPFASDLYQTIDSLFSKFAEQLGVSLEELLAIPTGQVAFALMPGEPADVIEEESKPDAELTDQQIAQRLRRRREAENSFAAVLIVDAGRNANLMKSVLSGIEESLLKGDFVDQTETMRGGTVRRFVRPRGEAEVFEFLERDGTFVLGAGRNSVAGVLMRMNDPTARVSDELSQPDETLAENADFAAVMSRSIGAEIEQPQVTFFINPYSIVRRLVSRSGGAAFVWPIVQELGIEKIRGVGGSLFRGGDIVEGIGHAHIVIDPPRDGFFGVLRPQQVISTPPDWVPADVGTYTSMGWDFAKAFENLGTIVNRFAGEGRFDTFTEQPLKTRLDFSLKEDLLAHMTGRYVRLGRYERPAAWNSLSRLDAVEIDDPEAMRAVLAKIQNKLPPGEMTAKEISGMTIYQPERQREPLEDRRMVRPQIWVMDNYLVFSDSDQMVEQVLRARSGALSRLVDDEDFSLLASELGAKLEGEKPFFLSFRRDADTLRWLYELAASPRTANQLKAAGENDPAMKQFSDLLTRQQLPDFDTLSKYFSATGIFGYDEPGGVHLGTITLRPEE